jgi:hypothetical protein
VSVSEDEIIARANRAQAILTDPLVVETFAGLEAVYISQWRDASSPEARETMWLLLQNLMTFRAAFGQYIRQGQVAVAARDQRERAKRQDAEP